LLVAFPPLRLVRELRRVELAGLAVELRTLRGIPHGVGQRDQRLYVLVVTPGRFLLLELAPELGDQRLVDGWCRRLGLGFRLRLGRGLGLVCARGMRRGLRLALRTHG